MTLGPSRLPNAGPATMTPREAGALAVAAVDGTADATAEDGPAAALEDEEDDDEAKADDDEGDGATSGKVLRMADTCACAGVCGVTRAARLERARRCAGVSVANTRRTLRGGCGGC